jgi:hypothetical protein
MSQRFPQQLHVALDRPPHSPDLDGLEVQVLESSRELFGEFRQLPLMAVIRAVMHAYRLHPEGADGEVVASARVRLLALPVPRCQEE